ncbi:MAG: ATP-binding protein, partial [Myxococcota bacterium]
SDLTLRDPVRIDVLLDETVSVVGDRSALGLAVTNLLLNAWKYTESEKREISLSVESTDREAEIVIRDNGPGIPRDEQRMIFEHFERGREAIDRRKSGSGLGLAIVRAIMTAHRGRVEVRSRLGHGAEFRLKLRKERI